MKSSATSHPWSEESLFSKAQHYVKQMEAHTADDWQFGFWSSLSLELLVRAALAHISPVLLGDSRNNWRNLTFALGKDQTAVRFSPRQVPIKEVLDRLKELVPAFNDEIFGFCIQHMERRNSELHSGELSFEGLGTSEWLPRFYIACNVLVESMDRKLEDLISKPTEAQQVINAFKDAAASTVRRDIAAHKTVWANKNSSERKVASEQATTWATRNTGHRVECPACGSQALLQGTPSGPVTESLVKDDIVQRQTMLPSSFECIACGLRIAGLSKLSSSGLGNAFSAKYTYTAAEFFELYTEDELEEARREGEEFEPDFNEL